ncbi:MAG: peptidase M3 [Alphaproteobacteria bacterium]|nr:MAG: peptidase M3 [Alphaproteobacteria bacterium]
MSDNPLLQKSTLPNQAPHFDLVKTEHYLPAIEEGIEQARANIDAIKNSDDAPTFENTLVALESASENLGQAASVFYNMLSSMGGDDLHELATKIGPINAKFSSDVSLDEKLFARIKAIYEQRDDLDLTAEQYTLLDDSYRGFVRSGALLDDERKERLREISQELSTLTPAFMQNTVKSAEAFELIIEDKADLAGLPDSAIDAAAHAAKEKSYDGKWLVTLDYPSFGPFMQYADSRDLREKIWRAFTSRAWNDDFDNSDNVKSIVSLRKERANLLGYDTHAHYVLEERMAKSPDTVMDFLNKMKIVYKPAAQKDLAQLTAFAKEEHGVDDLQPWDVGYYSEKLKQKLFEFTSEDFRPYYQLDKVLGGCFNHFTKLFGIKFVESDKYPTWHEDVKVFEVFNESDNSFVGTLYGDFHPRTGKNQGAWMTSYRDQGFFRGQIERPVIAIVCNFTKPTEDRPSLLTHGEVTTLFHEMGHAVHGLLSDVTYRSLSGTSVLWDFVELPSQLQENWCYEKEMLDSFAEHYETAEKIPADLIDKLRSSMHFMVGWAGLRQMGLASLDMAWHTADPDTIDDVATFEDEALKDTALFPRLSGPSSTSFGHIFAGGYSAGYYSYKWAEVLDADTFELFLEKGLYDQATAQSYKDNILTRGGSEKPDLLYKRFRGRDADPDALLRREGLLKK